MLSTVHVRGRDLKHVHDRPLESSHAFLPLTHHTSTVAKNSLLRAGRAVWHLGGCSNGPDRNKMRQSDSMDAVRQDLSQLRKSPDISIRSPVILTTVHARQAAG